MTGQHEPDDEGGRRDERLQVEAAAKLRPNGWSSVEIRMVDISRGGFRARCEARLQRGGTVSLDLPGIGAVEAQVEWQRSGEFGARFFRELPIEACSWRLAQKDSNLTNLWIGQSSAKRMTGARPEPQARRQVLTIRPFRKVRAHA